MYYLSMFFSLLLSYPMNSSNMFFSFLMYPFSIPFFLSHSPSRLNTQGGCVKSVTQYQFNICRSWIYGGCRVGLPLRVLHFSSSTSLEGVWRWPLLPLNSSSSTFLDGLHLSHFICHISFVTFHLSHCICHIAFVTLHL